LAARSFVEGLTLASTLPGTTHVDAVREVRLVPLERPWAAIVKSLDVLVWILLVVGAASRETRLPCTLALALWILPAFGNVFSPYELRYHLPMAGLGVASAGPVARDL